MNFTNWRICQYFNCWRDLDIVTVVVRAHIQAQSIEGDMTAILLLKLLFWILYLTLYIPWLAIEMYTSSYKFNQTWNFKILPLNYLNESSLIYRVINSLKPSKIIITPYMTQHTIIPDILDSILSLMVI